MAQSVEEGLLDASPCRPFAQEQQKTSGVVSVQVSGGNMGVPKMSGGDFADTNQVGVLGFSHGPLAPQINALAKSPLEVITAPNGKDDVEAGQALQEVEEAVSGAAPEPPLLSALAASVCMGGLSSAARWTWPR